MASVTRADRSGERVPLINDIENYTVEIEKNFRVITPERPLADSALQVVSSSAMQYIYWSQDDHAASWELLRRIIAVWRKNTTFTQYLVYGKWQRQESFRWEIVPYHSTDSWVWRMWQQFAVLWRVVFGGKTLSFFQRSEQVSFYTNLFRGSIRNSFGPSSEDERYDAFCNPQVIDRQWVLKGRQVNVLYDRAPIGFGKERLHFLVVPKKHRKQFTDLSRGEYLEAAALTQQLINYFLNRREIYTVYLWHKTGKDAGQTVNHWQMHVIFISTPTEDLLGKISVFMRMLFGSSPMKAEALQQKVSVFRQALA